MKAKTVHITPEAEKLFSLAATEAKTSVKKLLDAVLADAASSLETGDMMLLDRFEQRQKAEKRAMLEARMEETKRRMAALDAKNEDLY